ncbi:MAG TPA: glutamate racemase [Actinobacteria bacterium]|nr:glutamate racemase [Actinomycetota bacterium]
MIGVYDSGVGGLAVLRHIRRLLPNADMVYLADQAHMPYGVRSLEDVRRLAEAAVGSLVVRGADTVVVACNTASAAALQHLRSMFAVPIVGMEPAVKPAAAATRSGKVVVLATPTTFEGAVFDDLVGRFASGIDVIAYPCPGWAAAVEESWPAGSEAAIAAHLAPVIARGVDTIVLACTHYSFLDDAIVAAVGSGVTLIDPAEAVARQVVRVAATGGTGTTTYLTTGDPERLSRQIERLLGEQVVVEGV